MMPGPGKPSRIDAHRIRRGRSTDGVAPQLCSAVPGERASDDGVTRCSLVRSRTEFVAQVLRLAVDERARLRLTDGRLHVGDACLESLVHFGAAPGATERRGPRLRGDAILVEERLFEVV